MKGRMGPSASKPVQRSMNSRSRSRSRNRSVQRPVNPVQVQTKQRGRSKSRNVSVQKSIQAPVQTQKRARSRSRSVNRNDQAAQFLNSATPKPVIRKVPKGQFRSRAISAPPKLTKQPDNVFAQLPPPLIPDYNESRVLISPINTVVRRPDEAPTPRDAIIVYTDGSCLGNFASGVGIFFGKNHPLNLSQSLPGPHSALYAEIQAALMALERLHQWQGYDGRQVLVRSDCKAIVDRLKANNGFIDEEYDREFARLKLTAQRFPNGVIFEHIYGHNGHPGNEQADRLAGEATGRGRSRSVSVNRRGRSRSNSRNGRGAPNSTVFVGPKKENPDLIIPPKSER